MSFGRFFLAVESHDLSQADKSIMRVSSFFDFTKLQFLNDTLLCEVTINSIGKCFGFFFHPHLRIK